MKNNTPRYLEKAQAIMLKVILILHFAVFLSGFTGVFGRLITYDAFVLVYIRFIIAGLAAYAFVKITHKLVKVSFKDKLRFMFTGALLTLHLIFFYLSTNRMRKHCHLWR